ncbi:hypothetical protein ABMA27_016601 [Loxostege sticticalis]|uniref:Peptidase S1 domain-containing protein n=1 Tax=Loxostege sticticalis TaxID=481309 RepID=A0ABR3I2V1_LOXSC
MSAKINVRVNFITAIFFILYLKTSHGRRIRRIVSGMLVECGQHPRVVSIRNSTTGEHLCGATLLSPETAVTARRPLNKYCVGGCGACPEARVEEIIIYDNYDRFMSAHDMSILQISDDCAIYGYGQTTTDSGDLSERLLAGRVATVSLYECNQRLQPVAPDYDSGMICAVGYGGIDARVSGDPLVCDDSTLEGIISYGMSCGVLGLLGVYTIIVSALLSWIQYFLNKGPHTSTDHKIKNI